MPMTTKRFTNQFGEESASNVGRGCRNKEEGCVLFFFCGIE
jgi:hypothetical protein